MARPFLNTAGALRHGTFLDDCTAELERCTQAARETGKAAKLVIEITVKPASKGQGAVILSDKVRAKLPELPAGETVMFADADNNLTLNDPRQVELNLKSVSDTPGSLRNVG